MSIIKKLTLFTACAGLWVFAASAPLQAEHDRVEIDVWADHGFDDPYCPDDAFELYLRPAENCYITIMVIDPDGYANILYPLNRHQQRRLHRHRVYRLSELLDEPLYFYGLDGRAHISVIATKRPVFLNSWLLDEVYAYSYRPFSINAFGVRIDLGAVEFEGHFGYYWTRHIQSFGYSVFTTPIVIRHDYGHQHRYVPRPVHHRPVWHSRWKYRSPQPVFVHKDRHGDDRWQQKPDRRPWTRRDESAHDDRRAHKEQHSRDAHRPDFRDNRREDDRAVKQPRAKQTEQQPRTRTRKERDGGTDRVALQRESTRAKSSDRDEQKSEQARKPSRRTKKE